MASSAATTPRVRSSAAWGAERAPPVTTGGVSFPLDAVVVVVVVDPDEVADVEAGLLPWSVEGRG
jgi:hypothetical protein